MDEAQHDSFIVLESGALSLIQFTPAIALPATDTNDVQTELLEFITRHDCQKLVIDLSNTVYMPSRILGVLIVLCSKGVEVHLANASPDVETIMHVTKLDSRIHVNKYKLDATSPRPAAAPGRRPPAGESAAALDGYFVACPVCHREQQISKHLLGKAATCTGCHAAIHVDSSLLQTATDIFCTCPHCHDQLRLDRGQLSRSVTCKFCERQFELRKVL
ncbi:MAG: STAS domain-containing protein [Fuerstiella sp.]